MEILTSMLERLNAAVDRHNARVDAELDLEELTEEEARAWRVPPGVVTKELALAGPEKWSAALRRAVREVIVNEAPDEIIRLADLCPVQTKTIKYLRIGSKRSVGAQEGELKGFPVGIRLMDYAHLIAHANPSKVILLG